MNFLIRTNYQEFSLDVTVRSTTGRPERIRIILKDANTPHAVFTNRPATVLDEFTFKVRLPVTAKTAELMVYNERTGNVPAKGDSTFDIVDIAKKPLVKKLDIIDFANPDIRSFINFATNFSFYAGMLTSGNYPSDDGRFKIEYMPTILSNKTGMELNTPARINKKTGIIQLSQKKIVPMTIPMRMAILLHEFSHYYLNKNINDETEADINALIIYLGLGYPRVEAYEAFVGTFIGTPTPENKRRAEIIDKFIRDFENKNAVFYG